ncbi:YdgA family protein [Deinococcus sp.]|uniref:YdgA family protein n=1 Tax=Deinococcus sp. TaxID=47478 RepID=UPI0025C014E0|nr:YdgA family protein [Deinococcus sp.]
MTDPTPPARPARHTATRRPARPLATAAVGALLLAGAYAAATAVFSSRAQTLTTELTATLRGRAAASGAQVEQVSYTRGFMHSTQVLRLTLPGSTGTPQRLLITNDIQYGPLPALKGVGQATVTTTFRPEDPQAQAAYARAFPNRQPQVQTVIGLAGDTHSRVDVPGGTLTEQGAKVNWQALGGTVDVRGNDSRLNLNWPGLTVTDSSDGQLTSVQVGRVSLTGENRRSGPRDLIGLGSASLTLDRASVEAGADPMNLTGLNISAATTGQDQFLTSSVKYDVGTLTVPGPDGAVQTLRDLQLHLSLGHLAREPLDRLMVLLNDAQAGMNEARQAQPDQAESDPLAGLSAAQQTQARADLLALLQKGPVLTLDRLNVAQGAGNVTLTGRVALPGAATLDDTQLQALADQPAELLPLTDLQLKLSATQDALNALLGNVGPLAQMADIDTLVSAGYLKRSGDQLGLDLRIDQGRVTLNGQSLE